MRLRLLLVAAVAAAAAAAIALNLLLLGRASAQSDPLGRLSPKAKLPAAPAWTVRPAEAKHRDRERDGADD
jgi:hypothetical protein